MDEKRIQRINEVKALLENFSKSHLNDCEFRRWRTVVPGMANTCKTIAKLDVKIILLVFALSQVYLRFSHRFSF
jgi:hypothetical protein